MAKCQGGPSCDALVNVCVVKEDLPKKTSFMGNLGSRYIEEERATCETQCRKELKAFEELKECQRGTLA